MNEASLPVLIIGHARIETLITLVKIATESNVKSIYVALDGSQNEETIKNQEVIVETLTKIRNEFGIAIHIQQRKKNLGSGAGVINALDWFFTNEEAGIVLEDDLVVSREFFRYMNEIVPLIKSEKDILLASGTRLRENQSETASICSYPIVWGWGTSREKWNTMTNILFHAKDEFGPNVTLSEKWFWKTGKRRALKSQIDAWDIPLSSGMRAYNYFSVVPPVNLVSNVGFDAAATHTTSPSWPLQIKLDTWVPQPIQISQSEIEMHTNDELMRRKIFVIGRKNILTGMISIAMDPFRFIGRRKMIPMKTRAVQERGTNL